MNPLAGIDLNNPETRYTPTFISRDLTSPYSHQYNFTMEKRLGDRYVARAGYLGSRTIKLLAAHVTNRAERVPGIPVTLATIDERRADPRYYEVLNIVNGGHAYLDAAQFALEMPSRSGLSLAATYTFGKALDTGADFASTAANREVYSSRPQTQYDSYQDRKGLSNFDSPHSFLLFYSYELPRVTGSPGWASAVLGGWQFSGASLLKSGTPFTLFVGSDAPGIGNVDGSGSERPNILDPGILGATLGHPDTAPSIMSRDRFSYISIDQVAGTVGRNTFRKASIRNMNLSVSRQWRVGGSREWGLQFRGEAYNLTNTPQFDEPQRNLTSPSFGRITNTLNDGRVLQVGARLIL